MQNIFGLSKHIQTASDGKTYLALKTNQLIRTGKKNNIVTSLKLVELRLLVSAIIWTLSSSSKQIIKSH